jgi:hypothetical protein
MINFDAMVCNAYAKEKLFLQIAPAATSPCGSREGETTACLF